MRTLISAALIVTAVIFAPPSRADRPVVAFLGDSYTEGYLAPSGGRWSTLVADRMGWDERNFGVGGTGYATSSEHGVQYRERLDDVVAVNPSIVVVSGGVNDYRNFTDDPVGTAQAINDTYAALRARLPRSQIIAVGPTLSGMSQELVNMSAAVQNAAVTVDAKFVSLIEPAYVLRPNMFLPDGLHVDGEGHRAIADRVVDVITHPST